MILCSNKIRISGVYNITAQKIVTIFLVISKIRNCLKCWGGRGLTIVGRIQIFKTLAISKAFYISTMRTSLTQFLELLNSIQKYHNWSKPHSKIKHCSIIADYKEGGHKDVDFSSKLLAMRISRLMKI